ncbi:MAG: NAD(P)-dependent oxidoreductase [Thermoplasmatota archaeon]
MNYLITGASGYIGRNLLQQIASGDNNVIAVTHTHRPKIDNQNIKYLQGDISNPSFIKSLPSRIDVLIHCAALVSDYGWKKRFIDVNYNGTKYLVKHFQEGSIKQFIFLGHICYDKPSIFNYYVQTKKMAENFLINEYQTKKFPVTIIRPGNVFGPDASIWVNTIIDAIKLNRIRLINNGRGTFFHTYIDNLINAIILTIGNQKTIGETIDITDGDYNITWKKYFSDLAKIINEPSPYKSISKKMATFLGYLMIVRFFLFHKQPWITPTAVQLLTANKNISLEKAKTLLHYSPMIEYNTAMRKIEKWWNTSVSNSVKTRLRK